MQVQASNHLMLLYLKDMVVSDKEKFHSMGQVGMWETNESELLMNASRALRDVITMSVGKSWETSNRYLFTD
jgi:hypothetical protein